MNSGVTAYSIEKDDFIFGMEEERGNVTGLFVPLSVEVIGHYGNPVQILTEYWNVISGIYDGFARRNSS